MSASGGVLETEAPGNIRDMCACLRWRAHRLPKNPVGKVQRRALREMMQQAALSPNCHGP